MQSCSGAARRREQLHGQRRDIVIGAKSEKLARRTTPSGCACQASRNTSQTLQFDRRRSRRTGAWRQKVRTTSVATKIFREIAQFRDQGGAAAARRAEAVVAKRLAQRFVLGPGQGGCTEMHYSPRIWPERDPELRLIFLSLSPANPQGACGAAVAGPGLPAAHDSLRPPPWVSCVLEY